MYKEKVKLGGKWIWNPDQRNQVRSLSIEFSMDINTNKVNINILQIYDTY
jgi:hypothetical protein